MTRDKDAEIASLKAEVELLSSALAQECKCKSAIYMCKYCGHQSLGYECKRCLNEAELAQERERSEKLREALEEIEKTCPIIEEMSDVQLIKADGDDFLFRSTNRRRELARQALLESKRDEGDV